MTTYKGSITTTGTSEAIRLEKKLFKSHPEFEQKKKVVANVIAPGKLLISVIDDNEENKEEEDPIVEAFLAFIEQDMGASPQNIRAITSKELVEIEELIDGVEVHEDEEIPEGLL